MSIKEEMAIAMSKSEEKSVILKILSLYIITTTVFLGIFFLVYYERSYRLILHERSNELREIYTDVIEIINKNRGVKEKILSDLSKLGANFHLMVLDINKNPIYDTLGVDLPSKYIGKKNGVFVFDGYIFIDSKPPKHLRIHKKILLKPSISQSLKYQVIIRGGNILSDILWLRVKMIGFLLLCLFVVGIIAYFLLKLSLKPYKNKIAFLNRFIKDTTHEINTPISIIMMSIERLETEGISSSNLKKINRIHIAAKTLANVYKNIAFYSSLKYSKTNTYIDIKNLLAQRLDFFDPLFAQKNLKVITSLAPSFINANVDDIGCIIDNLLSNAIKYNKKNGEIYITLEANRLSIKDTGCGIRKEYIKDIFERYVRCNDSQGGFGIGLALIKELCDLYQINITCDSKVGEGSLFILQWKESSSKNLEINPKL